MQTLKDNTRDRILKAARGRFAKKGYTETSMRDIARAAGMGVGNIYHYFSSKDELFRAVVSPVVEELWRMLESHHGQNGEDAMEMFSETYLRKCVYEYLVLIDRRRVLMKILLFRAQGSTMETFRKQFSDRSMALVKEWFAANKQRHPEINIAVSDFFIHLHTVWMFALFEELLARDMRTHDIGRIVEEYVSFEIHGWKHLMNIDYPKL